MGNWSAINYLAHLILLNWKLPFVKSKPMKKYVILILLAIISFNCEKEKQIGETDKDKDTEIYLKVIREISPGISIEECIQFSDNRSQVVSIPGRSEYFTSIVNPNKSVTWMGAADSDPEIDIIEVELKQTEGSTQVLKQKKIKKSNGFVTGKVKDKGEIPNLSYQLYKITFVIQGDTLTIDPALQLHQ